jgi:protein O-mannosyl-transferase
VKEKAPDVTKVSLTARPLPVGYWVSGLGLLLAVLGYWPALGYGFVYDDIQQIVQNPAITSWSNVPQYFTSHVWAAVFPGLSGNYYRPLFLLWLRLNYVLFGVSPRGWHFTSLLAHLGAIWIFFLLARRWANDSLVAGWAALLFAVHPVHIEAVAWVSGVPESLFTLMGMGAIYTYIRYRDEQRGYLLLMAATLYVGALLTKETAIVVWPMIAACDWWLDRDPRQVQPSSLRTTLKRHGPFAAVTTAYVAIRIHALSGLAGGGTTHTVVNLLQVGPSLLWFYLSKLVVPSGLSPFYFDPDTVAFSSPHFYLPLAGVCAVAIGVFLWCRKSKVVVLPGLLLAMSLVPPVLGVMLFRSHELVHDRYLYLPSAGACMLLALALRAATQPMKWLNQSEPAWVGTLIVVAVSIGLSFAVRKQEMPYRDKLSLFSRGVQISPQNVMVLDFLGDELMTLGRYSEGLSAFQRAQSLEPDAYLNNYRLGQSYYFLKDMPMAEVYFQRAADSSRERQVVSFDYVLYRLGLSQYAQGKMPQAAATLQRAIELQPKGFGYHLALGAALKYQGNLPAAKQQFEMELSLGADAEAAALLREVEQELPGNKSHD